MKTTQILIAGFGGQGIGLRHTDGRQIAVALVCKYNVIRTAPLDTGGGSGSAALGSGWQPSAGSRYPSATGRAE